MYREAKPICYREAKPIVTEKQNMTLFIKLFMPLQSWPDADMKDIFHFEKQRAPPSLADYCNHGQMLIRKISFTLKSRGCLLVWQIVVHFALAGSEAFCIKAPTGCSDAAKLITVLKTTSATIIDVI